MRIGVIMGGVSSEKQVSIMTGNEMIANLDKNKYDIVPITLNEKMDLIEKAKDIDFALLALHGKYGEDGTVQGTLESLGIPYSGSNMLSSGICMDKNISKKILCYEGIETPDWIELTKMEDLNADELDKLGFPLVVKPNSGGSSVGVKIVYNKDELISMLETVFEWDSEVVIEKYIKGDEITCSIFDGKQLPIISIRHAAEFFDYNAKYDDTSTIEEVIELPAELKERVNKASLACYKVLKCSVYARVDMMVKDGIPYVMEINTLPGMTQASLLPKSAAAAGIEYSKLLDMIIETSLRVRKEEGF
ncbi:MULTISPECIES: D-alanine--D-alanine ligase [unclassified Bacillus cereus group]|uniref:D-alanine--D-alanine ligase n=1 Tax=unclassified Bacillus cereus group TaxID=2750818 RepID=UPI0022E11077|nr:MULTISPECIES: D-alanine--D-alanine ligase [unclassified Bacillus cereus group]MDA2215721.1 D-alanine--D-alanine ligase [Bacillus cereus group sp. Bc228]MDA2225903.1 D-alanine--D-alanine ligase [Bacillus cereus group sp. Bc227]